MQPFRASTTSPPPPSRGVAASRAEVRSGDEASACARLLLDTMPRVLKAVRCAVKNHENGCELTVPQFRALIFVHQHAGQSLSATAEFLGLSLPAASKLVDGLVRRGLLVRESDPADRRRMTLRMTASGDALLRGAQETVRRHLAGMLGRLDGAALSALAEALGVLQESFPPVGGESLERPETADRQAETTLRRQRAL